ncbi:MAG: hypothetical protein KIT09_31685 [Bryobacteraceae bacterium]|nr:hypothetical protein [Bryobacteraceae bacterium]
MSTTRLQEVLIAFGKGKQADIATAQVSAALWRFSKLNAALANPRLATESDADEYGKGHEFPTQTFKTSWDISGTLEKYLGAEIAAWAMAFSLGKVVKSGSAPNLTYTCTPLIPSNGDAAELPYFSFCEQIRPGAGVVLDRLAVGCAIESWQISIGSGPGRANSKISIEFVGSGKVVDSATGITMPAAQTEKLLPSASLTLSINGVDYVTNKNIVSLETGWKNNLRTDAGFFPGSGFQTAGDGSSGAIRGRLEFGNRQGNLKFVARFENGSTEYAKLKAQTTGTAVINLQYDANNSLQLTWQKISYSAVELGETDGILTVAVDCLPLYDSTNGIVSAVAACGVDGICQ